MRLFLDTSILIGGLRGRSKNAVRLLFELSHLLFTNEYALKEVRRVLLKYYELSPFEAETAISLIRKHCIILNTPPAEKYRKISLRDKSDIPIVLGAFKAGCTLVIDDEITYRDAKKYLKTLKSEEVLP
ncbi:MAG TPA: PIN domain-containing protein [Candidatus Norongarragalinales archaeon]|nr:PIN domain-containing protein [Candidatus Norongarragalinales archaeon]